VKLLTRRFISLLRICVCVTVAAVRTVERCSCYVWWPS